MLSKHRIHNFIPVLIRLAANRNGSSKNIFARGRIAGSHWKNWL